MQVVEDKDGEDHIIIVRVINIIMISQVPGGSGHAVHCSLLFHQGEAFSQEVQARANFTSNLMNSCAGTSVHNVHTSHQIIDLLLQYQFSDMFLPKTETTRSHIDDVEKRHKSTIMPKV